MFQKCNVGGLRVCNSPPALEASDFKQWWLKVPIEIAAKQKVKDEVDSETASEDWPTFNGAKVEPNIFDLSMSEEIPILNINISGDYTVEQLKEFAEYLQDDIEDLKEIKKADIRGAEEKEVEVVWGHAGQWDALREKYRLAFYTNAKEHTLGSLA